MKTLDWCLASIQLSLLVLPQPFPPTRHLCILATKTLAFCQKLSQPELLLLGRGQRRSLFENIIVAPGTIFVRFEICESVQITSIYESFDWRIQDSIRGDDDRDRFSSGNGNIESWAIVKKVKISAEGRHMCVRKETDDYVSLRTLELAKQSLEDTLHSFSRVNPNS